MSELSGRGPFMGRQMLRRSTTWGSNIMGKVDGKVECFVNNSYLVAKKILTENCPLLDHLANTLMEQEVVSAEEFQMMLVQFKAKTVGYGILGEERHCEDLPFQNLHTVKQFAMSHTYIRRSMCCSRIQYMLDSIYFHQLLRLHMLKVSMLPIRTLNLCS